ncbi:hypothetical protein V6N12_027500 [Hibiscus sabdariffa]|uniref:Uncharacterized protein n=1 Tax=Hibiscus sabdariffa TaxID=183260 RepID=A0ABR2F344_9ROSI
MLSGMIFISLSAMLFRSLGTGALINLLTLSWPLTLPTLIICSVLAVIFSICCRYQKIAAKLMQDFNACANNYLIVGCTRNTFFDENCPGLWNRRRRTWKVQVVAR